MLPLLKVVWVQRGSIAGVGVPGVAQRFTAAERTGVSHRRQISGDEEIALVLRAWETMTMGQRWGSFFRSCQSKTDNTSP